MSDLISREALCEYALNQKDKSITPNDIMRFPSAQPDPCGDVVSRNAIVQKLNEMDRYVSTELRLCDTDKKFPQNEVFIVDDVYEEIVEQLPSAQPDIVRCKDCKYYRKYGYVNGKPKFLPKCTFNSIYVNADDFCSRAERRTDD